MINIVNGSVLSTNYSEELQDSSGLTIPNLTLSAGQRFYIVYHYRNADDIQISAPVWNGQTAEPLIARHDGNGLFWVAPFVIVAQSSGTSDLTANILGINNPQYTYLNSTSFILEGDIDSTTEPQVQEYFSATGYVNPETVFTDLSPGDLVVSVLNTTSFNENFDTLTDTTWSAVNLDMLDGVVNSVSNYTYIQQLGVLEYNGGSETIGWQPSSGQPGYVSLSFVVKAANDTPTVSVNDNTIVSGSTGNTLTTTGDFTPTSGTIGGLPVSNITGTYPNFTFDLPETEDGDDHPFIGTVTASFTDGVDTVTTSVELLPKTGYDVVTLSGDLDTTINGVVYQFVPEAQENDQILFPTPQVEINSNGSGSTTESGTFVLYHISSVDNKIRVFNLIVGDVEEPDPEPEVPIMSNSNISLAGGMFSKMSIANLVNSRGKLPYIADSEASTVEDFVADLNALISAMRTANWFEEEPE